MFSSFLIVTHVNHDAVEAAEISCAAYYVWILRMVHMYSNRDCSLVRSLRGGMQEQTIGELDSPWEQLNRVPATASPQQRER